MAGVHSNDARQVIVLLDQLANLLLASLIVPFVNVVADDFDVLCRIAFAHGLLGQPVFKSLLAIQQIVF